MLAKSLLELGSDPGTGPLCRAGVASFLPVGKVLNGLSLKMQHTLFSWVSQLRGAERRLNFLLLRVRLCLFFFFF